MSHDLEHDIRGLYTNLVDKFAVKRLLRALLHIFFDTVGELSGLIVLKPKIAPAEAPIRFKTGVVGAKSSTDGGA